MWARLLVNERVTKEERRQSPGEEVANAVSAGAGLIAAIAGTPLLLAFGIQRGSDWTVSGAAVFAATTVWLYLASTVYHVLPRNRAKRLSRLFDHMGIFLLIAGTYTPFTNALINEHHECLALIAEENCVAAASCNHGMDLNFDNGLTHTSSPLILFPGMLRIILGFAREATVVSRTGSTITLVNSSNSSCA
ncbi:MAG: hemolysin III family protein [Verrucomicrobia bacterium]|nr:hemolysin III family protein [Verrucomicrobiota bacterium]